MNLLLRLLPAVFFGRGGGGFSVDGIAAEPQATMPQSANKAGSMS